MVNSTPESGTGPFFIFFRCSNDFITQCISRTWLMRVYFGLIMFAAFINLVKVLQVSVLAFHWLDDCANCVPTPDENDKYSNTHS